MHFFITGHTGFKGAWLTLLLKRLGHRVSGLSLEPVPGSLFSLGNLETELEHNFIADLRDFNAINNAIKIINPDFAVHLAAQPLVLRSYDDPVETFETNVTGTLNFLRAISGLDSPPTSLVVTTDKVYRDENKVEYVETDALGGVDPYSASKAMADILAQSWSATHPELKLFVARAGNVIGRFDVSENRLVPDIQRAISSGGTITVRNPESTRPWQHVLDCLCGYLMLLMKGNYAENIPKIYNFGPPSQNFKSVNDLIAEAKKTVPNLKSLHSDHPQTEKETKTLGLNSTRAESVLGWKNLVDFETSVKWSLQSVTNVSATDEVEKQIETFLNLGARSWLEG